VITQNAHGEQIHKLHNFIIKEMYQLQYTCVKMEEIGAVTEGVSSKFKPILMSAFENQDTYTLCIVQYIELVD